MSSEHLSVPRNLATAIGVLGVGRGIATNRRRRAASPVAGAGRRTDVKRLAARMRGEPEGPIRVAVVEEHDIFRRGIVACLADDPDVVVVFEGSVGPVPESSMVAVVSHRVAQREALGCPLVVCSSGDSSPGTYEQNSVLGWLPRSSFTEEQLVATVRAAAAGLYVQPRVESQPSPHVLDDRSIAVLRMLSEGADTQQISHALCYSERTVKAVISGIQRDLGARNRTHAVAAGIRNGFI